MPRTPAVRPEAIRRHNLSLMLREIHQHGELSRAELTSALSLNRSTIGALVADLVDLGLVTERVPDRRDGAGRPSHVVAPRPDGPWVLAVDVAVEQVSCAAVGIGGQIHDRRVTDISTGRDPASVARIITADADWLACRLNRPPPRAVGISVPGTVRDTDGFIEHAPNLQWQDVPFAALIAARFADMTGRQLEVRVGNDADLGAVAEHQRGSAVGIDNLVYVNGSVGVGAGVICDGVQLRGFGGYAGEIGHVMLNPDGPPCHCGSTGCVETYIGEHALLLAAGCTDPHHSGALATVFSLAAAGDPVARQGVRTVAMWLGRTLAGAVNMFNPQAIVVGGSLSDVLRIEEQTVLAELATRALAPARRELSVRLPGLAGDSPLVGAAEMAFQSLLTAPDSVSLALAAN